MDLIEELRVRETFLSTAEVMKLLRLSRGTLCEWVRSCRIPAIRVGNAYLFDPRKLADWLKTRATQKISSRRAS
jgi:excisionase family DNA binding protein